jgi:hypothetical protein
MKTMIVYESLFGNTREIAEAIARGVSDADPAARVDCVRTGEADTQRAVGVDLLILGGPTHAHGMTFAATRKQGLKNERQSAAAVLPGAAGPGCREFLRTLPPAASGARAAAFDTRADFRFAGGAAEGIARRLRHHGYRMLAAPEGFLVEDVAGPLRQGEPERARTWGAGVARLALRAGAPAGT